MRGIGCVWKCLLLLILFLYFYLRLFWWSYKRGLAAIGPQSLWKQICQLKCEPPKLFLICLQELIVLAGLLSVFYLFLFFYFLACHCDAWWYWCRFSCVHGFLTVPTYLQPTPLPLVQHQAKARAEPGSVWRVLSLPYSWAFSSTSGNSLPQQPECFHVRDVPVYYFYYLLCWNQLYMSQRQDNLSSTRESRSCCTSSSICHRCQAEIFSGRQYSLVWVSFNDCTLFLCSHIWLENQQQQLFISPRQLLYIHTTVCGNGQKISEDFILNLNKLLTRAQDLRQQMLDVE